MRLKLPVMTRKPDSNASALVDHDRLAGMLGFLQAAEQLKDTLRSGVSSRGRPESTAEHTWRLCLMILVFERELGGIDIQKLLKLCIVHDLGEALSGDIPAPLQAGHGDRLERERQDFETLCAPLPEEVRGGLLALWDEYARAETQEAKLAKGFDKLETMLQHLAGSNGPDFDFAFNLEYGRRYTEAHPLTREIRSHVDRLTRNRLAETAANHAPPG